MGTYRAQLKSATRLGMMTLATARAGGFEHWKKFHARGGASAFGSAFS